MTRSLLLALSVVFAAAVRADIIVPAVDAGQPFDIRIDGTSQCAPPTNPRLFIAGKIIIVTFTWIESCAIIPSPPIPWQATVAIPGLASGVYQLEVRAITGAGVSLYANTQFAVSGPPAGIEISPAFDANAGNRVVKIRGSFPCATTPCTPPVVLFGTVVAEGVEQISDSELDVLVPFQTNVRVVDVTVRGTNYAYLLPSGFTYVGNDYTPILFPVYTRHPLSGAQGSSWVTETRLLNRNQISLIRGIDVLYVDTDLPPDKLIASKLTMPRDDVDSPPTALAWIRNEFAPFVSAELRVRDTSRQSETWGTEVPVVFGGSFEMNLLNVPVRDGFRSLLRIYSAVYGGCCGVTVKFRDAEGVVVTSRSLQLQHPVGSIGGLAPPPYRREGSRELPLQPAYAEIDLLSIVELQGRDPLWIEVAPSMPAWAMVSVTNNATQHVTMITPH